MVPWCDEQCLQFPIHMHGEFVHLSNGSEQINEIAFKMVFTQMYYELSPLVLIYFLVFNTRIL